jgi:hypothetical protein
MSDTATLRFQMSAGIILRRQVRSLLYYTSTYHSVQITVDEDKGWLDSMFYVTVSGEESDLKRFQQDIQDRVNSFNS